ncbi:HrcA family transcriptional regulator [Sulfurospirillum arcachonense]|uniref:HrcA family transcriptional regulator n=1 Tax=Sulfurospirillum arcachonense TaxID=57666 RepID=UPI00046893E7|nr:HrcA family transcriptional regulator [Sulfurospirillum arcachonense]
MKRISKRDIILEAIIQEYLNSGEPIGSNELQMKIDMEISPSTIRIYLKKLSEEGALVQLHVSSGRVPTNDALINYWKDRLNPTKTLEISSIENMEDSVNEHGLFCIAQKSTREFFREIIEVSDRFLILSFDTQEVVLKYSEQVKRFLSNLIGCEIRELKNISAQVGLYELHDKLHQILSSFPILLAGESQLYEIAKEQEDRSFINQFLNYEFSFGLKEGVYFDGFVPNGCMAIKQLATIEENDANLFCFGKIDSDFESFMNYTCK